jgi:5-methylcytosine-specific restriction endonuclease McrA
VEGKPGALGEACGAPGCHSASQHRHHIWPRSYLRGQPYEWVKIGEITKQNTVGLCVECHDAVTGGSGGHRAKIVYDRDRDLFEWHAKMEDDSWAFVGFLRNQALIQEPEARPVRRQEGLCGECGRPLRSHDSRAQKLGIEPRKVKTWAVIVPDDAEVGSDVMDDWIDQFAVMLGFGEAPTRLRRYHVLAVLLAWAAQSKTQLLHDLEEAEFFAA